MSIFQRNRASSVGFLRSPARSARRASGSLQAVAVSMLGSIPSCPTLTSLLSPEKDSELKTVKRGLGRVTSVPFIRRKGDFAGSGQGDIAFHLGVSRLIPPRPAALRIPSSRLTFTKSIHDKSSREGVSTTFSVPPYKTPNQTMPKAPQLSFRSPISSPKMLPLPSGIYAPKAKPLSPEISSSATQGLRYDCRQAESQAATVTAVLEPHRRSPPPGSRPALRIVCSTEDEHVLSVRLPGFAPEMVTLSVRRDDKLAVVADLWHAESNCHHEWLVAFSSRDVNVSQTRAQFSADGTLTIHVPRRNVNFYWMRSRLR